MSLHKPSILEEEYFVREEAEKVEILKRTEEAQALHADQEAERQLHASHCPSCGASMKVVQYETLPLLRCQSCCGVFLNGVAARKLLHEKEPGYWSHMIHALVATWEADR